MRLPVSYPTLPRPSLANLRVPLVKAKKRPVILVHPPVTQKLPRSDRSEAVPNSSETFPVGLLYSAVMLPE